MHETPINLLSNTRHEVVQLLNKRLVDAIDLGVQTKLAHWNVRGKHFYGLHLLFDKVFETVEESTDLLAERIGQLGELVKANIQETAEHTSLPVASSQVSEGLEVVKQLVTSLAAFSNTARKDIDKAAELGDAVTADILTGIVREIDKQIWFVESHLQ